MIPAKDDFRLELVSTKGRMTEHAAEEHNGRVGFPGLPMIGRRVAIFLLPLREMEEMFQRAARISRRLLCHGQSFRSQLRQRSARL